ncbi:hypothetical protein BHE74_00035630 [Ensete ventricosum]|nr:hypothetical protein GW17_00012883 [Ensete ventricosum]RWW57567.1 hypothetical protein BHE74_00035630 [Ensete ventricosum]
MVIFRAPISTIWTCRVDFFIGNGILTFRFEARKGGKRREEVDRDQYHKLDQKRELDQGQAQYQEKASGFRLC